MNTDSDLLTFNYTFAFDDGTRKEFRVELNPETLDRVRPRAEQTPEWTELQHSQCENCPLDAAEHESCPVAVSIAELVNVFSDTFSYEKVNVSIVTSRRNIWKNTSVQESVSSLLGIYMPTSGCPVMGKLKPMVRFHLPFASVQETLVRTTSMYLLAQYLRNKNNMKPDWEMNGLMSLYESIMGVNQGMSKRLKSVSAKDANINALVHLDVFAWTVPYEVGTALNRLTPLFSAYLDE